ncbi:MAG TPA: DUF4870 domain-containing protein [Candidatus Paceibacterota bacterium]
MPNEHEHHAEVAQHPEAAKQSDKNIMAIFAYLSILIIIPFLTDAKDNPFVKYHIKQGLVLLIFEVIGWFANIVLVWIPVIGALIIWLWWLASLVLAIIGIMNVVNGKEKELPYLGKYATKFVF